MKTRAIRVLTVTIIITALIAGTAITASAAQPDNDKEIEAMSKWLDGLTLTPGSGTADPAKPSGSDTTVTTAAKLTEDELKAYADKVFELVNKERENQGLTLLTRDSLLDEAATIRAAEVKAVDNIGGAAHTRPDGTSYKTLLDDMGIASNRCGENIARARATAKEAVDAWMASDGHRRNILRENYGSIGIGVYQRPDGKIDCVQIFELA